MNGQLIILISIAYLVGSIPCGLLLSKGFYNRDPRLSGSGNIGATNVSRVAGKPLGVATLILDMAKGALPTALSMWFLEKDWQVGMVAAAAFMGHIFPIYLRFKGGKGVATALGGFIAMAPLAAGGILLVLGLGAWASGHMSVGSLAGWTTAPVWLWIVGYSWKLILLASLLTAVMFWTHRENLARLRSGQEHGWR